MTDRRIVYTRLDDGGVSVCCPTGWAIAGMSRGGMWGPLKRGDLDDMIAKSVAGGRPADAAARFIRAMHFGGCSTQEALCIIRDRDCAPHGRNIELWDVSEIPQDRWFRSAWRRSHNGGPISIDLALARPIQWQAVRSAVEAENRRRANDLDRFDEPLTVDWSALSRAIKRARDEDELRRIWPEELKDKAPWH